MDQHHCNIHLWGEKIGTVVQMNNRKTFFQYSKGFLSRGLEPSPIHLPVVSEPYETTSLIQFSGLPGFLSDSLPDNYGARIMEKHFIDQFGIPPYEISPIQKLLYIGHRGQGALEFDPPEKLTIETQRSLKIAQLVDQARKVVSGNAIDVLTDVFQYSSDSLNGVKAKATLGWNRKDNKMISGAAVMPQEYEPWIVKFDGTSKDKVHEYHCVNEYLYLKMAKECGINVCESDLITDGDYTHLAVKRFDRNGNDKPFHVTSLAGVAHIDFRDRDTMNYDLFFRITMRLTNDVSQLEEAYSRMVFNVLSGNQDDHAKNHSFIMDKRGEWSLSPAYDLSPTFGNGHQMAINYKTKGVSLDDLIIMSQRYGINKADEIIERHLSVLQKYEMMAKEFEVPNSVITTIKNGMK